MESSRLLGRTADVAFIAACVIVSAFAIARWTAPTTPELQAATLETVIGTRLDAQVASDLSGPTVVVAVSTQCRFCTESADFYRRLVSAQAAAKGQWQLAFYGLQSPDQVREYLAALGVECLDVRPLTSALRVTATPTLLITGADHVVLRAYSGRLSSAQERETLRFLRELE